MSYPPEPWRLRGSLHLTLWRIPEGDLPATPVRTPPLLVGGSGFVGTAWVVYGPGSVLEYEELLAAVLVRDRRSPRAHISHIWVNSAPSQRGGRELWGIPKERAEFQVRSDTGDTRTARAAGFGAAGIAAAGFARTARLPGSAPFAFRIAQDLNGFQQTGVRGASPVSWCASDWRFDPDGPLGWLGGRRPVASLAMAGFDMNFGTAR
ncbi:acetoacetate decarboxylase family protein [Saccharopolyspora sp. MS10]|uniref:acetoacetate decarboxylase family protein n=1 Tax=Saccharopolyspora sp. MS10 TaxID=3385973 RepID=UPI00399FB651